jgi:hypothetical protein
MIHNRALIQHYAPCTVENTPLNKQHRHLRMCLWYQKETFNLWPRGCLGVRNWPSVQKVSDSKSADLVRIILTSNLSIYGEHQVLPWFGWRIKL